MECHLSIAVTLHPVTMMCWAFDMVASSACEESSWWQKRKAPSRCIFELLNTKSNTIR